MTGAVREHGLRRTDFGCELCGRLWPCPPARVQLGERYAGDRTGLALLMSAYLYDAVRALAQPGAPGELFDRFIAWTRYPVLPGGGP